MQTLAGFRGPPGQGFTLVELLLAVVLLTLLLGALVFNFSGFGQQARLEEGAARLETLLRLAQAQAALSGRQVQIVFQADGDSNALEPSSSLRVQWELAPLETPGQFEDLVGDQWQTQGITEMVRIQSVTLLGAASGNPSTLLSAAEQTTSAPDDFLSDELPTLTFYPDGSGDSAEIILVPLEETDLRRVVLRINGLTGAIRRELRGPPGEDLMEPPLPEDQPPGSSASQNRSTTPRTPPASPPAGADTPPPAEPPAP